VTAAALGYHKTESTCEQNTRVSLIAHTRIKINGRTAVPPATWCTGRAETAEHRGAVGTARAGASGTTAGAGRRRSATPRAGPPVP
jgi:hypothetical protein